MESGGAGQTQGSRDPQIPQMQGDSLGIPCAPTSPHGVFWPSIQLLYACFSQDSKGPVSILNCVPAAALFLPHSKGYQGCISNAPQWAA